MKNKNKDLNMNQNNPIANENDAMDPNDLFAPDWKEKSLSRTRRRQERIKRHDQDYEPLAHSVPSKQESKDIVQIDPSVLQQDQNSTKQKDLDDTIEQATIASKLESSMNQAGTKTYKRPFLVPALLLSVALIGSSLGVSWYLGKDATGNTLATLYEEEKTQYNDYANTIHSLTKPEGWSDQAFENLKFAALQAYDQSQLNTLSLALEGNIDAKAQADHLTSVSSQNGIEAFKNLFTKPDSIPMNVINVAEHEDMIDFVMSYGQSAAIDPNQVTLGDVTQQMPDLKTFDPAWGYIDYGIGCFAANGAAPTVIADVFSFCLDDPTLTPYRVAQWANEAGYALNPVVSADDNIVLAASGQFGVNLNPLLNYSTLITDQIAYGYPVILITGTIEAPYFYAVYGLDEAGNWLAYDPLSASSPVVLNPEQTEQTLIKAYALW